MKQLLLGGALSCAVMLASCGEKPAVKEEMNIVKVDPATVERIATKTAYFGDLHVHKKTRLMRLLLEPEQQQMMLIGLRKGRPLSTITVWRGVCADLWTFWW